MKYPKILTGIFLGMFLIANAQNDNSHETLLAGGDLPGVTAKKLGPNTVVYSYSGKAQKNEIESKTEKSFETETNKAPNDDNYQYPPMRLRQGAVLPFEVVFNGSVNSAEGIQAQENYFKTLMLKPEQNKIVYQDIETTRARLNDAGIYDAQDMNYFDMPLIAKIVGAGVLVTAKINVKNKKDASANEYDTEVIFKIYNPNGKPIFIKREAPFTATTRNSYLTSLDHVMTLTPFYHKL